MLQKLKQLLNYQFIRFLLVGFVNTIFGYLVYAFFIYLGFYFTLASLFTNIIGVLFNFQTYGRLVFYNFKYKFLYRFILIYIGVYIVHITGIDFFRHLGLNDYISGMTVIPLIAVTSYLGNRHLVFIASTKKDNPTAKDDNRSVSMPLKVMSVSRFAIKQLLIGLISWTIGNLVVDSLNWADSAVWSVGGIIFVALAILSDRGENGILRQN